MYILWRYAKNNLYCCRKYWFLHHMHVSFINVHWQKSNPYIYIYVVSDISGAQKGSWNHEYHPPSTNMAPFNWGLGCILKFQVNAMNCDKQYSTAWRKRVGDEWISDNLHANSHLLIASKLYALFRNGSLFPAFACRIVLMILYQPEE
jgi:hypothetical protein